jgi:glycopeptide antibiotics resistance protein
MLRRLSFYVTWLLWTLLIVTIVFPWRDLQDHTHWGKVLWVPFVSPPVKAIDLVGNVLLYVPFGFLASRAIRRSMLVVSGAVLLSFLTESAQLYSHARYPSTTDFICNLAGCMLGLYAALPAARTETLGLPQEIRS